MKKTMPIALLLALCLCMGMGAAVAFASEPVQQQLTVSESDLQMSAPASSAATVPSGTTGLYKVRGVWRYYENGKFAAKTGLVKCVFKGSVHYGKWFFVKKGKLSNAMGLVKCIQKDSKSKGKWFHVKKGKKTTFTGLVRKSAGSKKYYYVRNGKHVRYTGAVYQSGKYHYVRKGVKNKSYRGHVKINGSTYKVRNGICSYDRYWNLRYPERYVSYSPHCYVDRSGGTVLRYGPSAKYGVKKKISNGTMLIECGYNSNYDWFYVRDSNYNYGWVKTKHVRFYGGLAKPAIYLYPEKPTDVSVSVSLREGRLTNTIPSYGAGWHVTAYPNGTIVDAADGSTYPYLFWEADSQLAYDWSEGYVIEGAKTKEFLGRILPEIGLSPRETADFIDFWLDRMEKNEYNLITFQTECYTDAARLNIDPAPDSLLRVFMAYKPLEKPIAVKAPEVQGFDRVGFTVVEWGGTEVL